jgi:dTDP-4-amino-4,6-dideoxygalactose transaminase
MAADAGVPLLDLKAQFAQIKDEVLPRVQEVFEQQAFILGPHVNRAEEELAAYLGAPHAVGVSSGTDALLLSLMALEVGPGDGVVTTPFTFFATAGSIVRLGALPLFADIDPDTYNLDPAEVERLLGRDDLPARPKAMIPVHLFGQPAEMARLNGLAEKHGLAVVEDAAQAIGAAYPPPAGGAPVKCGNLGHTGCFSFFPSKNLGGAGDGGLITCADDDLAVKLRSMRTHGSHPKEKYRHLWVGGNFRLDAVQAAVVSAKLPHLDDWSAARRANAARYGGLLEQAGLLSRGQVSPPLVSWPDLPQAHVFNQYVVRVQDRPGLMRHLAGRGIGHAVYYPTPLHLAECFAGLGHRPGDMPHAEKAAGEVLALPVFPELTEEQQATVVQAIKDFYG